MSRCTTVRVIDRGPFVAGRTFDLTIATARVIGFPLAAGVATIHWRKVANIATEDA